jgi:hypothetical protein
MIFSMETRIFSLTDIQALYATSLAPALNSPPIMLSAFSTFINAAYDHYEEMTPEAIAFLKEREEAMVKLLNHINNQLPDGVEKRKMNRLLSATSGKQLQAKRLIDNFPVLRNNDEVVKKGDGLFEKALQRFLDFMHDISAQAHNGPASFARINLLYWAIDELTAANFLSKRGYTTLTYAHLRCVVEILDKVELFGKRPEMVEIWVDGGPEHEIYQKLSPPKVRRLLGRDNKDPIYSHFSHQGAHPTYTAAQMRMTRSAQTNGVLNVGIGVGGKSNPPEQAALMGFCIMLANLCTMRASLAFPEDLNEAEVSSVAKAATDEQLAFSEALSKAYPNIEALNSESLGILVGAWSEMAKSSRTTT